MENKIYKTLKSAMDELDGIADSFGVARSTHISLLAGYLIELRNMIAEIAKELEELRKFKEEHTEHDDQRNKVQAES